MFEFERLTLDNFALYSNLSLDLSTGPGGSGPSDVVLIRGHNEHGKTTLFRGLMWTVFGYEALDQAEQLGAREAMRLQGLKGKQEHRGELFFRSDATKYRIMRVATTVENDPVPRETVRVHKYNPTDPTNPWKDDPSGERTLAAFYFPPNLAPYLFLNADKVSTIVGDATSSARKTDEVTHAIDDMLGITIVKKSIERVKAQRHAIEREILAKVGSDKVKDGLEAEVARLSAAVTEQESSYDKAGERIEALSRQLEVTKSELTALEEGDAATAVYARRNDAERERSRRAAVYHDAMKKLREDFSSPSLYLPFFTKQLAQVEARLSELRVEGIIPQAELPLLTKLLNVVTNPKQLCVCGETSIAPGTEAYETLQRLVDRSRDFEEGANRLDKIRADLVELLKSHVAQDRAWPASFGVRVGDVQTARGELEAAQSEFDDADQAVKEYERQAKREQLQLLRAEVEGIQGQLVTAKAQQSVAGAKLDGGFDTLGHSHGKGLRSELLGAQRKLRSYFDTVKDAQHLTQAVKAADRVVEVLEGTVRSIQHDQVAAVSERMNALFLTITNNGALVIGDEPGNLPVTSRVGIREVPARAGHFELYAETSSGVSKPLAILNGASRQALTVSFMVALLENSNAPIPLVTDSLFHPLSGSVKFRLAQHLLVPQVQKITFFTHDDVQSPEIRHLLMQHAARTYTLSNSAKPRDLANAPTPEASVVMICNCGPSQFCETCELAATDGTNPTHGLVENPSPKRVL
jgi:DNA sulfur modification protein DndD